jgi:TonB family protein
MNAETHAPAPVPLADGWSWKKIGLVIILAFAAHLAFVFLLGAKKNIAPRGVKNVPVFHLADNRSELVRLTDPTLFVLPHADGFAPAGGSQPPAPPANNWPAPPAYLTLNPANLGAAFNAFMQTNRFAARQLNFKPAPQLFLPPVTIESALPQTSSWQLAGKIVGRQLLNTHTFSVPTLAVNDVLAPSRVQLLVDKSGNVLSAVLLETSGNDNADRQALDLARTLQFVPAEKLMFGEITFNWHTVPASAP